MEEEYINNNENEDENPFFEEFDKENVINKTDIVEETGEVGDYIYENLKDNAEEVDEFDKLKSELQNSLLIRNLDFAGPLSKEQEQTIKFNLIKDIKLDILVDSILNYSDDKRLEKSFENEYSDSDNSTDEERRMLSFGDFIIAPKISGTVAGIAYTNRIPAEKVNDSGKSIEIQDNPELDSEYKKLSTVYINRNTDGDIESIEVICQCGEKTLINIDFDENEDIIGENVNIDFTSSYVRNSHEAHNHDEIKLT